MHHRIARAVLQWLMPARVLDPFCGSGTVLVQAQRLGRAPIGGDLNPIAVELARLKTARLGPRFAPALEAAAEAVMTHAKQRQEAELGPTIKYGAEDRALFAPHVLLELDGLRAGIDGLEDPGIARSLRLVLSAMLTKVSTKTGDSSSRQTPKRLARGYTIRFFGRKAHDLALRAAEARAKTPARSPSARVELLDARELGFVKRRSIALIVSSPPYPGVYDYFEHHKLRLRWLRIDGRALAHGEIGARRAASRGVASIADWEQDFSRCLAEMQRVLRPGAQAALLVADSSLSGRPLYVDAWLPRLAQRASLSVVARASQTRPHFHGPSARAFGLEARREHLVILEAR
jgi:SAM-dependent methyltransferase